VKPAQCVAVGSVPLEEVAATAGGGCASGVALKQRRTERRLPNLVAQSKMAGVVAVEVGVEA
jgi:hypothetical protein